MLRTLWEVAVPALDLRRAVRHAQATVLATLRRALSRFPRLKAQLGRLYRALPSALQGVDMGNADYQAYRAAVTPDAEALAALRSQTRGWAVRPLVSVLVATYDTSPGHLRGCLDSVRAQAYENWELCLVDDCSPDPATWELLQALALEDARIRTVRRERNGGISAATNDALGLATGEFCVLLDHDDLLEPDALAELVRVLQDDPGADFVYTDEDKVTDQTGRHLDPHFKPDWSPELLWSANYITHLAFVRTSLLRQVGGFDSTCDGSQDWDLFLRLAAATGRIRHVPRILYSWRVHERSTAQDMSTKPYALAAQRRALEKAVAAAGVDAEVVQDPLWSAYWQVRREVAGNPLVSVLLLARELNEALGRRVASVLRRSGYDHIEVIVLDLGGAAPTDGRVLASLRDDARVRVERPQGPVGDAEAVNRMAGLARGDILVLLGERTVADSQGWLRILVAQAQRPEVGAVGCLGLYAGGSLVRHAGVSLGVADAVAVNILDEAPLAGRMSIAQHMQVWTQRDVSAVSGECLAVRRDVWDEFGGYDETLPVLADVDLCCRLRESGLRIVYTPQAVVAHLDWSRALFRDDAERLAVARRHFERRWPELLARDPFRNPAFAGSGSAYALTLPTRTV